jgi:hypothetical protein
MIEIARDEIGALLHGAFDVECTDTGLIPLRIPARLAFQVPPGYSSEVFRMPSGVRLAFETEATALELDVAARRPVVDGGLELPEHACTFDLVVDGRMHATRTIAEVGTRTLDLDGNVIGEERRRTTVRFDGLPAGGKTVELWLPTPVVVELCALRADAPLRPWEDRRPRWVHYGSSISHCYEAHSPTQTWPAVAARSADVDLLSLGVAGECFLDPFAARAIRDTPATWISLKLGINIVNADAMKLRTFEPAVHGLLDTVREGHPDTPILVVSPIVCPPHEEAPGPTLARDATGPFVAAAAPVSPEVARFALSVRRIRSILEEVVRVRSADDANLHYLDGLTLFGEADAVDLPDLLHPNGDGYVRIGERFAAAAFGPGGVFART